MLHKQKKHHPDLAAIRRQGKLVCQAIERLTALGIEVQRIVFSEATATIEVANCPGNDKLASETRGQGAKAGGAQYIRHTAHVQGCVVVWEASA